MNGGHFPARRRCWTESEFSYQAHKHNISLLFSLISTGMLSKENNFHFVIPPDPLQFHILIIYSTQLASVHYRVRITISFSFSAPIVFGRQSKDNNFHIVGTVRITIISHSHNLLPAIGFDSLQSRVSLCLFFVQFQLCLACGLSRIIFISLISLESL